MVVLKTYNIPSDEQAHNMEIDVPSQAASLQLCFPTQFNLYSTYKIPGIPQFFLPIHLRPCMFFLSCHLPCCVFWGIAAVDSRIQA